MKAKTTAGRKASTKTPTSKSKCGGKDRLTAEQRRRVLEYAKSLKTKSVSVKSSLATKQDGDLQMERSVTGIHPSTTAGRTPYKNAGLSNHSPERKTEVSRERIVASNEPTRRLATARAPRVSVGPKPVVGADCKGLVDPPSFIRATEASNGIVENKMRSIGPPCKDDPPEATKTSVNTGNVAQKDGSPTTPSFSEDLTSLWCFMRRSLQALGLTSSTQGNGNTDNTNSDDNYYVHYRQK